MAYIKFKTGLRQLVPDDKAVSIWLAKYGFLDVDPEQKHFIDCVSTIHIDYRHAPDEYIRRNLNEIIPRVLMSWRVDASGRPACPCTREDYIFAEKWGLWAKGKPTALVIDPEQQLSLV